MTRFLTAILLISINALQAQTGMGHLRNSILNILKDYRAEVGVSLHHIERGDTLNIRDQHCYPMLSVYKLPEAMAVLDLVDAGKIRLNDTMRITPQDIAPETWSPMKSKYPKGNVTQTIAELLKYSVSFSDNIACDMLFRLLGGPQVAESYMRKIGYKDIFINATEDQLHLGRKPQEKNCCRPSTITSLLLALHRNQHLSDSSRRFLMHLLTESFNSAKRIRGLLPEELKIAHKTGTSGADEQGLQVACNDAGIIYMHDGSQIVLSVFVSNSSETYEENEVIVARITQAVYHHYLGYESDIAKKNIIAGIDTLRYRLITPAGNPGKKLPLLVYLHGSGTRGGDNESVLKKLHRSFLDTAMRRRYPCFLLVPQCPVTDAWVEFPGFPKSLKSTTEPTKAAATTMKLIQRLVQTLQIDAERIYLTGYSLGGEGTFDLIARDPGLFACGVPLAGVGDTATAAKLKYVPFWIFHGENDDINPVKYSKLMYDAIRAKGGKPRCTWIPGRGHDCREEAYGNKEVWDWMFTQKRTR